MEISNLLWGSLKWRFQNSAKIVMNITEPLIWLLLYSIMFRPQGAAIDFWEYLRIFLFMLMLAVPVFLLAVHMLKCKTQER